MTFTYRPRCSTWARAITAATALALALWWLMDPSRAALGASAPTQPRDAERDSRPRSRGRLLWRGRRLPRRFCADSRAVHHSRIFFVRDLSFFFWSRHLWLRHTLASGKAPWWDPYVAGGQSAIADALNQPLMPLTLAMRLLPSDVVSFNLWVALPLPLAALGMYLFLERSGKPPASAALGACVFALSGVDRVDAQHAQPGLEHRGAALGDVDDRAPPERALGATGRRLAVAFALQALSRRAGHRAQRRRWWS